MRHFRNDSLLFYFKVCKVTDESTEFLKNRLGRKYADGADGPIVHFYKFFWPQKCVMRS